MADIDPFDDPGSAGSGSFPAVAQLKGRLLLVEPTDLEKKIPSKLNEGKFVDRITANVHVLDGDPIPGVIDKDGDMVTEFDEPLTPPFALEDMYLSQTVLVNQLRKAYKTETKILGRLGQLPAREKGQNKAWAFESPSDSDKTAAREYLAKIATEKKDPWD